MDRVAGDSGEAFRAWAARTFERSVRLTGLGPEQLAAALVALMGRPLPGGPDAIFDWCRGDAPVPLEVFAATCHLAGVPPNMTIQLDPEALPKQKRSDGPDRSARRWWRPT